MTDATPLAQQRFGPAGYCPRCEARALYERRTASGRRWAVCEACRHAYELEGVVMSETTLIVLAAGQRLHVLAALGVYREDLAKAATKAAELGKDAVADAWTAEVRQIQETLVPRIREGSTDLEGFEVKQCRSALIRYVKKLRAAASTVEALYEELMGQALTAKADTVEQETSLVFADQTTLALEAGTAATGGDTDPETLARIEDMTPGPGGRGRRNKKGKK